MKLLYELLRLQVPAPHLTRSDGGRHVRLSADTTSHTDASRPHSVRKNTELFAHSQTRRHREAATRHATTRAHRARPKIGELSPQSRHKANTPPLISSEPDRTDGSAQCREPPSHRLGTRARASPVANPAPSPAPMSKVGSVITYHHTDAEQCCGRCPRKVPMR